MNEHPVSYPESDALGAALGAYRSNPTPEARRRADRVPACTHRVIVDGLTSAFLAASATFIAFPLHCAFCCATALGGRLACVAQCESLTARLNVCKGKRPSMWTLRPKNPTRLEWTQIDRPRVSEFSVFIDSKE